LQLQAAPETQHGCVGWRAVFAAAEPFLADAEAWRAAHPDDVEEEEEEVGGYDCVHCSFAVFSQ